MCPKRFSTLKKSCDFARWSKPWRPSVSGCVFFAGFPRGSLGFPSGFSRFSHIFPRISPGFPKFPQGFPTALPRHRILFVSCGQPRFGDEVFANALDKQLANLRRSWAEALGIAQGGCLVTPRAATRGQVAMADGNEHDCPCDSGGDGRWLMVVNMIVYDVWWFNGELI